MEAVGFNINGEMLDELKSKIQKRNRETQKEIYDFCEEEFNIIHQSN